MLRGPPWVFSGAVAKVIGEVSPGDVGEVYSSDGQFLGLGHLNPRSQIIVRVLTQKKEELGEKPNGIIGKMNTKLIPLH